MTRLLFWIAFAILVVLAVRSKLRAMLDAGAQAGPASPAPGPAAGASGPPAGGAQQRVEDQSERMACCARCGLHFPSSEAVTADGREYCCRAHAPAA